MSSENCQDEFILVSAKMRRDTTRRRVLRSLYEWFGRSWGVRPTPALQWTRIGPLRLYVSTISGARQTPPFAPLVMGQSPSPPLAGGRDLRCGSSAGALPRGLRNLSLDDETIKNPQLLLLLVPPSAVILFSGEHARPPQPDIDHRLVKNAVCLIYLLS